MADPLETFSEKSRRVLKLSELEAIGLNHALIGSEHVLLAFMREDMNETRELLKQIGLEYEPVKAKVKELNRRSNSDVRRLDLKTDTKQLLMGAVVEARSHGHTVIDVEHLLVAMAILKGGTIGQLFRQLNINTNTLLQNFRALLSRHPIIIAAEQEALTLKHPYVEPEHLLLAILRQEDSKAYQVLHEFGLSYLSAQNLTRKLIRHQLDSDQLPSLSHEMSLVLKASLLPGKDLTPDYFLFMLVRDIWPLQPLLALAGIEPDKFRRQVYLALPEFVPERVRKRAAEKPINPMLEEFHRFLLWCWHFIPLPLRQLLLRLFKKQE